MAASNHGASHEQGHTHEAGAHSALVGDAACCTHHEIQSERYLLLYLIGGMLLVGSFVAKTVLAPRIDGAIAELPALIAAVILSVPLFVASVKELRSGRASSSSLAALAILASIATGKFEVAGWLAFILLVADQFLRRTAFGAQRVIEQLVRLTPNVARIVRGEAEVEVRIAEVKVGDTVRVRAGENLPVDGLVVNGRSTVDQASLTGEAVPHEVQPGEPVYAGTTNLSGTIDLRCTTVGADTTIGKVTQLIREAERAKSPRQLLIEQVAGFFVPVILCIACVVLFLTKSPETFITVLVVTCPSALLLASPTATVAAFAAAARLGIMVKEARYLEAAAAVDTVVMDKTGTITTGKFAVARLAPATGVDGAELLSAAANAEQQSNHPLARSIIATAKAARITLDGATSVEEIHGRGVRARTSMGELCVGRASWIGELLPAAQGQLAEVSGKIEGMTGVHVAKDGRYLGAVGLEDKVRSNTKGVIERLRELGVRRLSIFTGDRLGVAERVGRAVGVDTIEAECLPEEKHAQIKALARQGRRVLMVGDGINDGPSLAAADVGVAMGLAGSDIATNSAGVALMNDDLSRIPFMIDLARRMRAIITQNVVAAVLIALVGLALAATDNLAIWGAALFHFVGDVFVLANSFRLFRFGEGESTLDADPEEAAAAPRQREASMRLSAPVAAGA